MRDPGKIDREVGRLPGVRVLHKAGWINVARHDNGIVLWPGGAIVVTVMTYGSRRCRDVSSDVLAGRVASRRQLAALPRLSRPAGDPGKIDREVGKLGGVRVLHKAGWINVARHDNGIVLWPGGAFVVTVMTYRSGGAGIASDVLAGKVASAALTPLPRLAAREATTSGRPQAGAHHVRGHALGVRDRGRCPVPGGDIRETGLQILRLWAARGFVRVP